MNNCNCHCENNGAAEALIAIGAAYGISKIHQKWKMKRRIKKYLKIVVEFSNLIQDEKNILQDMKKANFNQQDINEQYDYVLRLINKQRNTIRDLVLVELQYPREIHNRFFYFKDKNIFEN